MITIATIHPRNLIIILGVLTLVSSVAAQERGACVLARVPEAYELPDGSVHEAGRLTLCLSQALSPVVGLHRLAVDGHTLGLARGRRAIAKESRDVTEPLVLFRRHAGRLELVGYVVRVDRKVWSYALAEEPPPHAAPGELVALLGRLD
ncbi:MAG TPA: hypothetical protein VJ826_02030 [Candidatus Polarisedimenticolaceae bacterium]|nr:hypothetical protein [Candidatus Polarisedimenticolaceae bacterium]